MSLPARIEPTPEPGPPVAAGAARDGERTSVSTPAAPRPDAETAAVAVFTALADPTRRVILAELAGNGPATATDLADRLPISRQAITKHLGLLADAGLVSAATGERRRIRYRLQPGPITVAQSFLAALATDWDDRLQAMRIHVDQTP